MKEKKIKKNVLFFGLAEKFINAEEIKFGRKNEKIKL